MDKNKIIEAVGKLVAKGAYDRAIKEYEKILEVDPRDIRIIQKIAELYQKNNQPDRAAQYFAQVAENYASDGFFQKAVALYKQVMKLNPEMVEVVLRLAELNEQLLLLSDAMAYYQLAAGIYEKRGETRQAISLYSKMVEVDPESIAIRVKLAELYSQEGMQADAVEALTKTAASLRSQNRMDDYLRVVERLTTLEPNNLPRIRDLAETYLARSEHKKALSKLQACFQQNPKDVDTLRLLANAFLGLGQIDKTVSVFKQLAAAYAEESRNEEVDRVWQQIAQLAPQDADVLTRGNRPSNRENSSSGSSLMFSPAATSETGQHASTPTQVGKEHFRKLLAETNVYLKYGLFDKALEHLGKIFSVDPENLEAHEKAYEIYLLSNNGAQAQEQLLNVLRLCARRAEIERSQPYLDELLSRAPQHPELQAFLAVLRATQTEGDPPAEDVIEELGDESILVEANDDQLIEDFSSQADEDIVPLGLDLQIDEQASFSDIEMEKTKISPGSIAIENDIMVPSEEGAASESLLFQEECDEASFLIEQALWDEALEVLSAVLLASPGHARATEMMELLERKRAAPHLSPEKEVEPVELASAEEPLETNIAFEEGDLQYSAEEILTEFKRNVQRVVNPEDVSTHYDLGIAYKEMGLIDDAVEEFEMARLGCEGQPREADCLTLIGILKMASGQIDEAITTFRRVLGLETTATETSKGVRYELASALEAKGDLGKALFHYLAVERLDEGHRDVSARVKALSEQVAPEFDAVENLEANQRMEFSSEVPENIATKSRRVGYV